MEVIGPEGMFTASNGMRMAAHRTYDDAINGYDLVLVAGGPRLPEDLPDESMVECVRRLSKSSRRTSSVCTGAFVLGQAGLLAGRRVTTHWQSADALAKRFPDTVVDRDRIYVKDGDLITSAGVTAGIDLALAIVGEDHGSAVSLAVAKRLVVVARRQGGQSQFSPYVVAPSDPRSPLATISEFVMANLRARPSRDMSIRIAKSRRPATVARSQAAKT